ncbi:MAG: DUF2231 domain-containing protein [Marmoricola sp.]
MELNGIPLHPLVIHVAVVFVPVAVLAALGYALVPRWRHWLLWTLLVTGIVAGVSTQLAAMTGDQLKSQRHLGGPLVEQHEMWAGRLQAGAWVLAALAVLAVVPALRRPGGLQKALFVLLPIVAVVDAYLVYQTGDAGARAVWQAGAAG